MTWAATEQYLTQLIGLLRGEVVEIDGAPTADDPPRRLRRRPPVSTPILVGANGPKGLAVAERVGADGVVSIFGGQPGWDWCSLFAYGTVLDDGETLADERVLDAAGPGRGGGVPRHVRGRPGAAGRASRAAPQWREAIERFPERERHLHTHREHFVGMTDRDLASVTPDLIGSTTWTGTAAELRGRLDDAAAGGVTEFMYAPMGSDLRRELEAFRSLF